MGANQLPAGRRGRPGTHRDRFTRSRAPLTHSADMQAKGLPCATMRTGETIAPIWWRTSVRGRHSDCCDFSPVGFALWDARARSVGRRGGRSGRRAERIRQRPNWPAAIFYCSIEGCARAASPSACPPVRLCAPVWLAGGRPAGRPKWPTGCRRAGRTQQRAPADRPVGQVNLRRQLAASPPAIWPQISQRAQ